MRREKFSYGVMHKDRVKWKEIKKNMSTGWDFISFNPDLWQRKKSKEENKLKRKCRKEENVALYHARVSNKE